MNCANGKPVVREATNGWAERERARMRPGGMGGGEGLSLDIMVAKTTKMYISAERRTLSGVDLAVVHPNQTNKASLTQEKRKKKKRDRTTTLWLNHNQRLQYIQTGPPK